MAAAEEDMDSLFEGMELIDPSQLADSDNGTDRTPDPPSIDAPTSSATPEPLDENLFSDLILVSPLQTSPDDDESRFSHSHLSPDASGTVSTTAALTITTTSRTREVSEVGRQSSRKKKRAVGLRIGYGRDNSLTSDDVPSLSSASDPNFPPSLSTDAPELDALPESNGVSRSESVASHSETLADSRSSSPAISVSEADATLKEENDHGLVSEEESVKKQEPEEEEKHHDNDKDDEKDYDDEEACTSIEVQFERIEVQISEKLKRARELAASISAARKDSIRRRRKSAEDVILMSCKYTELEKELDKACEAEDFEMAERVSESLAVAEKEKQALLNALREAEAECDAIDTKMQEVLNCQVAAEQECAFLLESFVTDATNNADLLLKKAKVLSSQEMDQWLSSTESLEVKKMELEIESHLINEARGVLTNSIEHSIGDDGREKEFLFKKKEILKNELEKLYALVKEKETEIEENECNIKAVQERIANVVSGFREMQSSIDSIYDNLQSGLSNVDLESKALLTKKKEIDEFLNQEEERGVKLRELARVSADEAKAYHEVVGLRQSLMTSILKSREDKVRLAKTEEKLSEDVQILQQEVSTARASLQELSSTKSSFQQDISTLKQRILFIDKRIPELEAEKKVAAAARNFKEAARVAAEAKSLSVEKEGVQIELERAILEFGKLKEEIKETVDRLQDIEGMISSKEKKVAMARFQRLLLIAGAARAESSAALELGDTEEANLLLAEAEAADSEAKKLQPLYNFKEEECGNLPKHFISMELVSNVGGKQLAELAASVHLSAA